MSVSCLSQGPVGYGDMGIWGSVERQMMECMSVQQRGRVPTNLFQDLFRLANITELRSIKTDLTAQQRKSIS